MSIQKNQSRARNTQSGNVLFLVLIGIAMFGALSYTVASMLNSGDTQYISEERADLYAGEILDYTRKVRETVQFLKISNDCDDTDISFENNVVSGFEHSPAADDECKVFHSDGGGMTYVSTNKNALDSNLSASSLFGNIVFFGGARIINVGSSESDLLMGVPFLTERVCIALNKQLGIDETIAVDNFVGGIFTGSFTATGTPEIGDEATHLAGHTGFCLERTTGSNPSYVYVQAIIVR